MASEGGRPQVVDRPGSRVVAHSWHVRRCSQGDVRHAVPYVDRRHSVLADSRRRQGQWPLSSLRALIVLSRISIFAIVSCLLRLPRQIARILLQARVLLQAKDAPAATLTPARFASSTSQIWRSRENCLRRASAPRSRAWPLASASMRQIRESLTPLRDFTSASNNVRHVVFGQTVDGIRVLDAEIQVHLDGAGRAVRITSSAARGQSRRNARLIPAAQAAVAAAANVRPSVAFSPVPVGPQAQTARFARGPFKSDVVVTPAWFPMSDALRLAWLVDIEPDGDPQRYDVVVDAASGEVLLRRNNILYASGQGRVLQSAAMTLLDARRPEQHPTGVAECPPVVNHELRDLASPFRDPATVLGATGTLSGNNTHVFPRTCRRYGGRAGGILTSSGRMDFRFPVRVLRRRRNVDVLRANFVHDFFYDLGFDEAAGNFQADNFGRGGPEAIRADLESRRPKQRHVHAPDGSSPTISMFLWDGAGCWGPTSTATVRPISTATTTSTSSSTSSTTA